MHRNSSKIQQRKEKQTKSFIKEQDFDQERGKFKCIYLYIYVLIQHAKD